ncbi:MAG: carbon monoxide dehydrogenase subunit G [Planctomycetota bacterium]|jgi:carbon monoxide dehydrogenase subunit G
MAVITVSTNVAAPIEETFAVYTQIDKAAERIPGIDSIEMLSEGPFGNGTRWRETRVMFKMKAVEEMWVTGFDAPNGYSIEAESRGMHYTTLISFTPEGDGTKVSWEFAGTPLTRGTKIMSPVLNVLMTGTMRKCMLRDLEALRDVCEKKEA